MIFYDQCQYPSVLYDYDVQEIEEKYNIKCLYGGISGSHAYKATNPGSDFDFTFAFIARENSSDYIHIDSKKPLIEFFCYNLEILEQSNALCLNKVKKFPSFYTEYRRPPEEDRGVEIFRILCSDYIWDSGYLQKNLAKVVKKIDPILILDYLFSRTAGNLENSLSLESVLTKRVIRTVFNLSCMLWILEQRTLPYLGFEEMTRKFHGGEIGQRIFEILDIHRSCVPGGKAPEVPRDETLNQYIQSCLKGIESAIHRIDRDTFSITLDPKSFLGKLVQSGQFKIEGGSPAL